MKCLLREQGMERDGKRTNFIASETAPLKRTKIRLRAQLLVKQCRHEWYNKSNYFSIINMICTV